MDEQQAFLDSLSTLLDKITWLNQDALATQLKGFKSAEVHTIDFIGHHPTANVTQIANSLYVTRGAVSKMTRRLITKNLIERYQSPENKKEVYFRLTPAGKHVFDTHARLHQQFNQRDAPVFANADPKQLAATLAFLTDYNEFLDEQIKNHAD